MNALGDWGDRCGYSGFLGSGINWREPRFTLHAPRVMPAPRPWFSMSPRCHRRFSLRCAGRNRISDLRVGNLARWPRARFGAGGRRAVQDATLRALKYFPGFRGENARGVGAADREWNVAMTRPQKGAQGAGRSAAWTSSSKLAAGGGGMRARSPRGDRGCGKKMNG